MSASISATCADRLASAEGHGLSSYWMLVENKRGNYSFLKGIAPYSAGVVAEAGFEVVHVRLPRYIPLRSGFDAVEAHLKTAGRPLPARCGMELRSPKPFSSPASISSTQATLMSSRSGTFSLRA